MLGVGRGAGASVLPVLAFATAVRSRSRWRATRSALSCARLGCSARRGCSSSSERPVKSTTSPIVVVAALAAQLYAADLQRLTSSAVNGMQALIAIVPT